MLRTHDAGALNSAAIGNKVVLAGWVARRRDHGGVAFIDLRDSTGAVQVVINDEKIAGELRAEWCVLIKGEVKARPAGSENGLRAAVQRRGNPHPTRHLDSALMPGLA